MLVGVTGASGFLGGEIVRQLLAHGHRVKGTVRSANASWKMAPLMIMQGLWGRDGALQIVEADLLDKASLLTAFEGCDAVLHVASPVIFSSPDPEKEILKPALEGTLNVLRACHATPTIQRLVFTSSIAAIIDDSKVKKGYIFTEKDWNESSSLENHPYRYSKVRAERAVWDFVKQEKPSFCVTAIHPGTVIGPSIASFPSADAINLTNRLLLDVLQNTSGYPAGGTTLVHVNDVARAHVLALEMDRNLIDGKRYVCNDRSVTFADICKVVEEELPHVEAPRHLDPSLPSLRLEVPELSNAAIRRDFGITFSDWRATVVDTVEWLAEEGFLQHNLSPEGDDDTTGENPSRASSD